jgi:hypothetical protein
MDLDFGSWYMYLPKTLNLAIEKKDRRCRSAGNSSASGLKIDRFFMMSPQKRRTAKPFVSGCLPAQQAS